MLPQAAGAADEELEKADPKLEKAKAELEKAKAELEKAKQELKEAEAKAEPKIKEAKQELKEAQQDLTVAQVDWINQGEPDTGPVRRRLDFAVRALGRAEQQVSIMQTGVTMAQAGVTMAQAGVNTAQARVDTAQDAVTKAQGSIPGKDLPFCQRARVLGLAWLREPSGGSRAEGRRRGLYQRESEEGTVSLVLSYCVIPSRYIALRQGRVRKQPRT